MNFLKNYSMMLFKSMTVLLVIAFTFSSCKKDKDDVVAPPAVSPVVGKWIGTLTFESAPVGNVYLVIKQDGTVEAQNSAAQKTGEGTWKLGGSAGVTFSCSFTTNGGSQKTNLLGTLIEPTKINGSWGTGNSQFNGGFFNVTKQP